MGSFVGLAVGSSVGSFVGLAVGGTVGTFVGLVVRGTVGAFVGLAVLGFVVIGALVGLEVGADVTITFPNSAVFGEEGTPIRGIRNPGEITVCEVHKKIRK
jgi:hypothetical protein